MESGTATDTVATLLEDQWYNLWVRVDNVADTLQLWLNTGVGTSATEIDELSDALGEQVFSFRTSTAGDLSTLYWKSGSGGPGDFGPLYFDDIYLETTETLNLNNPTAITCDPMNAGDFDGNGTVEFADFLLLSANFGREVPNHTFGDFDCDGEVTFADFLGLSANFGKSVDAGLEAVPEPGPVAWWVVALAGASRRRRRSA